MRFSFCLNAVLPLLIASPASAIVLFNLDNSANQTDPGTGVPWTSVGRVQTSGGANTAGSAVYLGNGYLLTANHVNTTSGSFNQVQFGTGPVYPIDFSYTPTIVSPGVDMKVFRLLDHNPAGVEAATILGTADELIAPATIIGWGRGRDALVTVGSINVTWGADSTMAKRWGLNEPKALTDVTYTFGPDTYNYQTIVTIAGAASGTPSGLGDSEASVATYDSGGGMFQFIGGQWYLIGLTVAAEFNGNVTFGDDSTAAPRGDASFFARVSNYDTQIAALVPEPSAWAAGLGLGVLGLVLVRRRRA